MLIAELERRSGLSRDTIRYYERQGLLTPPQRGENGYRRYDAHSLVELGFIAKAQAVGFALKQIKPALAKLRAPPAQCQDLISSLQEKAVEIQARIAQDRLRLARLKQMIERLQGGPV